MPNINDLNLTFVAQPNVNARIYAKYYVQLQNGSLTEFNFIFRFVAARQNPGEVTIANSNVQQAINFMTAFNADYANTAWQGTRVDNQVFLTLTTGQPVFDAYHDGATNFVTFDGNSIVSLPGTTREYYFAGDYNEFDCTPITLENYFDIQVEIKSYQWDTISFSLKTFNIAAQPRAFAFGNRASFSIDEVVQRSFESSKWPLNYNATQLRFSDVKLTVREKNQQGFIQRSEIVNVKFAPGCSFNLTGSDDLQVINSNTSATPYKFLHNTVPGVIPVAFFNHDFTTVSIQTFINGAVESTVNVNPNSNSLFIYPLSVEATEGDKIEIVLTVGNLFFGSLHYIVWPEGMYQRFIVGESQWMTPLLLQIAGAVQTKPEFDRTVAERYERRIKRKEIVDIDKQTKLTFSTGWLSAKDVDLVEQILECRKVFIYLDDWTEILPESKSIIKQDTERELIDYNLEFHLNKTDNEVTRIF